MRCVSNGVILDRNFFMLENPNDILKAYSKHYPELQHLTTLEEYRQALRVQIREQLIKRSEHINWEENPSLLKKAVETNFEWIDTSIRKYYDPNKTFDYSKPKKYFFRDEKISSDKKDIVIDDSRKIEKCTIENDEIIL